MKNYKLLFACVIGLLILAGCASTSTSRTNNLDFVGLEEPLGLTREELKELYGIEVPANNIVPDFPNVGDLGGLSFDQNGRLTRIELPFPLNEFDNLVRRNTEQLGEPIQRGADLVIWNLKPSAKIFAFVQRYPGLVVAGAAYGN